MSEIRYNRMEDSYVLIAPERLRRPDFMAWTKEEHNKTVCPFCIGNEKFTPTEIYAIRDDKSFPNEKGWSTRVIPNLYKAVQIEAPHQIKHIGSHEVWEGFGAHEIIVDTAVHLVLLSHWTETTFFHWLKTMQARVRDLRNEKRIAFISLFKNHGPFAGATQTHPHTQLIGLPVVPKDIMRKYERMAHYHMDSGRLLIDDLIEEEEHDGRRIILKRDNFVAFCPFASEYPFEVIIASNTLPAEIDQIDDNDLLELASILPIVFYKMESQLGDFDFNMSISVPPMHKSNEMESICRFNIRIMPRIYKQGGFELSTGTMINPVAPEHCAKLLREQSEDV